MCRRPCAGVRRFVGVQASRSSRICARLVMVHRWMSASDLPGYSGASSQSWYLVARASAERSTKSAWRPARRAPQKSDSRPELVGEMVETIRKIGGGAQKRKEGRKKNGFWARAQVCEVLECRLRRGGPRAVGVARRRPRSWRVRRTARRWPRAASRSPRRAPRRTTRSSRGDRASEARCRSCVSECWT